MVYSYEIRALTTEECVIAETERFSGTHGSPGLPKRFPFELNYFQLDGWTYAYTCRNIWYRLAPTGQKGDGRPDDNPQRSSNGPNVFTVLSKNAGRLNRGNPKRENGKKINARVEGTTLTGHTKSDDFNTKFTRHCWCTCPSVLGQMSVKVIHLVPGKRQPFR